MKNFRVVVLSHGGAGRVLRYLHELDGVDVVSLFVEIETDPKRSLFQKIQRSIRYDGWLETSRKTLSKVFQRQANNSVGSQEIYEARRELKELCANLKVPYYEVTSYHSEESIGLLKGINADLGIIYGTNIVKESVFNIPKHGSINVHQGLTPHYRGGPPLFWELFNGEAEAGITVHFVASKVDAGDIILQKSIPLIYDFLEYGLEYETFLRDQKASLAEPSAKLVVEAVKLISRGDERRSEQDLTVGKRYRLPTKKEKDQLVNILERRRIQLKNAGGQDNPRQVT